MKAIFTILLLLSAPMAFSQVQYDTVFHGPGLVWHLVEKGQYDEMRDAPIHQQGDIIYLRDEHLELYVGQDLKLGLGTMPNGSFKFISFTRANWVSAMYGKYEPNYLGAKWTGHLFKVKGLITYGNKRRGHTYYLRLGGGNIVDYECDIVNAINAGEIIIDGYTPPSQRPVIIQQQAATSLADELKKLKDLLDQGVLTQAEFDTQKQKLLAK